MLTLTNLPLWLQLVTGVATTIAEKNGDAPKELGYLNLLTQGARLATITDADLLTLKQQIEAEKAGGIETTPQEIIDLEERLLGRSAGIQSA